MKKKPRREHPMHSQGGSQDGAAATKIQRAVLVLSLGSRPFFKVTRPLIENFAARVSATLHVLSSVEHPALQPHMRRLKSTPRFLKLPALHYYLQRYNQVLFFDDDVVVSPRMADIFEAVEPALIGAVFERHKPQGWHSMHWRTACAIYNVSSCKPKSSLLFNSGVMLLSRQHLPLLARWQERQLECRVLCDQLFFNAVAAQRGIAVSDLGASFNFVGSEVRRAVVTSSEGRPIQDKAARRAALRAACVVHLTRKVPKLYLAHWIARRALTQQDVMQCFQNSSAAAIEGSKELLLRLLPIEEKYDIGVELCKGEPPGCKAQPWVQVA
mmetsp:Transcript_15897/g.33774  ORF Transcript_15897/g.33774 Transcript_15897/m.33774 type:complete len:327 (+) Transcript_15897:233-1213(+)